MKKNDIVVNGKEIKYNDIPVIKHEENLKGRIVEETTSNKYDSSKKK